MLVQFGLIVSHDVGGETGRGDGGGGAREWLCTCRMDSTPGGALWDKSQWQTFAGATKAVLEVRYTPGHAPAALFPHIVASQMSSPEYKAEHRRRQKLQGGMLSVQLQARNPNPESRNPKPGTRNPKPETRSPKP